MNKYEASDHCIAKRRWIEYDKWRNESSTFTTLIMASDGPYSRCFFISRTSKNTERQFLASLHVCWPSHGFWQLKTVCRLLESQYCGCLWLILREYEQKSVACFLAIPPSRYFDVALWRVSTHSGHRSFTVQLPCFSAPSAFPVLSGLLWRSGGPKNRFSTTGNAPCQMYGLLAGGGPSELNSPYVH